MFLVVYELRGCVPHINHNYGDFYTTMKDEVAAEFKYMHVMETMWLVESELDAEAIYNKLKPLMYKTDQIFIYPLDLQEKFTGYMFLSAWKLLGRRQENQSENQSEK